jgi:hypothetical protein
MYMILVNPVYIVNQTHIFCEDAVLGFQNYSFVLRVNEWIGAMDVAVK